MTCNDTRPVDTAVQDVRDRLERIEENECDCDELPHAEALHHLARHDAPALLTRVAELQDVIRRQQDQLALRAHAAVLQGAMLGDPLLRLTAVVAAVRRYRDELAALGGPQAEYARDLDMALANEVWDEGFPPGGLVCGTCGQPVESEPCAEHTGRTLPSDERNEHRG